MRIARDENRANGSSPPHARGVISHPGITAPPRKMGPKRHDVGWPRKVQRGPPSDPVDHGDAVSAKSHARSAPNGGGRNCRRVAPSGSTILLKTSQPAAPLASQVKPYLPPAGSHYLLTWDIGLTPDAAW